MNISLNGATPSDMPLIVELFRSASAHGHHGVAYPKWDSAEEVASELEAYGAALSTSVYLVENGDGVIGGVTGFLGSAEDDFAYIIGPIFREPPTDVHEYANILDVLEPIAKERNLHRLKASIAADADARLRALAMRGYVRKATAVEMVFEKATATPAPRPLPASTSRVSLETLTSASKSAWLHAIATLLEQELEWTGDSILRLQSYVSDPYRVRVALAEEEEEEEKGEPCGVLITWADNAAPFARIEYLAVDPRARKKGIGELLLRDAITHLQSNGPVDIFLQVDEHRAPAIRLYERLGMTRTQVSVAFEKELITR